MQKSADELRQRNRTSWIALHGSVSQAAVGRQTTRHEQALARTPGNRRHSAQTAKGVVVSRLYGVATLGKQRRKHFDADAGHREQDGRIGWLSRRRWLCLRGRVGVVRRSSLGELTDQPVERTARAVELAVDQDEAFGDQLHMRNGGFDCARRYLDSRRS